MKAFKLLFVSIFVVSLLASVGCKSSQPTSQVVHDSIYVERTKEVTVHDTVFTTAPSQVSIKLPCDSFIQKGFKPVSKTVKNATLKVERVGKALSIDCYCDTLQIKAQLRHTIEKEYTARSKLSNTVKTIEVRFIPWYVKVLAWCGGISILALLFYLLFKKLW